MIYFVTVNYYSSNLIAELVNSIAKGGCDGVKGNGDRKFNHIIKSNDSPTLTPNIDYQIIIINNSPDDDAIHHLKSDNILIIEAGSNLGFGQACNLGLNWIYKQDPQATVWIINPDTCVLPNALEKAAAFFKEYSKLSIVGTIIYTLSGEIWFAGGEFITEIGEIKTNVSIKNTELPYLKTDWVSGCSLLINFTNFASCPQFNPDYFLYYEDFDFCQRYQKEGHLITITHQIGVVHEPSAITGKNMAAKFKHSTYSYLLTIEKYTNKHILIVRFTRLLFNAIYLIPTKPKVAFGKLHGMWLYLRRGIKS